MVGVVDGAALAARLPTAEGVHLLTSEAPCDTDDLVVPRSREWLEVVGDVVTGLGRAFEVTVLDLPRDLATVEAVAGLVDAVVVVVGTQLPQLASASTSTVALRRALSPPATDAAGPSGWSAAPPESWLVLRGGTVPDGLADVVVDHLDLPLLGVVHDENRLATDLEKGMAPGVRGRGSLVEVADDLLLRLVVTERVA